MGDTREDPWETGAASGGVRTKEKAAVGAQGGPAEYKWSRVQESARFWGDAHRWPTAQDGSGHGWRTAGEVDRIFSGRSSCLLPAPLGESLRTWRKAESPRFTRSSGCHGEDFQAMGEVEQAMDQKVNMKWMPRVRI